MTTDLSTPIWRDAAATDIAVGDRIRLTDPTSGDIFELAVAAFSNGPGGLYAQAAGGWGYPLEDNLKLQRAADIPTKDGVYLPYASKSVPNVWLKRGSLWLEMPNAIGGMVRELDPRLVIDALDRIVYLGTGVTE